jgi:hypothetical protein
MSNPETGDGHPKPADFSARFVVFMMLLAILARLALVAAGAGALLGMAVAVVGWGVSALGMGAGAGAAIGLLLLGAWCVVVACSTGPEEEPAGGQAPPTPTNPSERERP